MKALKSYDSQIKSNTSNVRSLVDNIIDFICKSYNSINEDVLFDIRVVLNELFQNAVRHGNKEDDNKVVRVRTGIVNKGYIYFVIEDEGEGFNYNCVYDVCNQLRGDVDFCQLKENGRGMLIVRNLCDRVRFNKKGNKVVVLKRLY